MYRCPFCNERFQYLVQLKYHVRQAHLPEGGGKTCPVCGRFASSYYGVLNHMKYRISRGDRRHAAAYIALTGRTGKITRLRKKAYELLRDLDDG